MFSLQKPPYPVWLISLIFGFVFAAIAILTLQSPINHFGLLDPLIYQSYIWDYQYLIDLQGYTYFSSRVAWILPSSISQTLLGDGAGYLPIRILLLGGAASALGTLVGRFCRGPFAIYAAAWYCFCPYLLRAFAHDYVDGAAAAYAMIGLGCILTAQPKAYLQHLAGGVFLALAIPVCAAAPWLMLRSKIDDNTNVMQ